MKKTMKSRIIVIAIFISLSFGLSSHQAIAHNNDSVDPKELESFLDDFFTKKMEGDHIPGVVFVLVKDGEIIVRKGYGYADVEKKIPVNPEATIFRVGSISKLFTATAVMQLFEQGQIDLKANVNDYLKLFKLENNYPEPVTIANLLTHTAGFRGRPIGSWTRRESDRMPLGEFLAAHMAPRELPPGKYISYSNDGFYLAGYLVEETSGIPFAQYIADRILAPLGMEHSSFLLPPHLLPNLAKCYSYVDGSYQSVPIEFSKLLSSPAGSLISTADDMARFMIAHLQGGRYQDQRILNENTCREMQQQQFTNDSRLPGTCYGFYEYQGYNHRAIFHDGDVTGFSNRFFLLPDQNMGFFICNNDGNSLMRMELTDSLMSHCFPLPEESVPSKPAADIKSPDKRLSGSYRSLRFGLDYFDKFESASALLNLSDENINSWIESEPLLFQVPRTKTRLVFREDSEGKITHLFIDAQQMPMTYERVAWYDTATFLWIPYVFFLLVFLSACAVWAVVHNIWRKRKQLVEMSRSARSARLLAIVTVTLNLIFFAAFTPSMFLLNDEFVYGLPFVIKASLVIPLATTLLAVGLLVFALLAWKHKWWSYVERLHYSLIAFACIALILWLYHWNWLGFRY